MWLTILTCVSELLVQVRDPASKNNVERNQRRLPASTADFPMHAHTYVHALVHTCAPYTCRHVYMYTPH